MGASSSRLGLSVVFVVATFLFVLTPALSYACTCGGLQCWSCPPWPPNHCGGVLNPACSTNGCQNANCTCETPTCGEAPAVPCMGDVECECSDPVGCNCPRTCPITTLQPCGGATTCQNCGTAVCTCHPVCGGPALCGGQAPDCDCGGTGCACAPHCQGEPAACGGTATNCNCGVTGCDCGLRCAPQFCAQQVGLCMCLGAGCDCTTATTCDGAPPCGGTAEVCSLAQGGGCAKAGCECGTFCGHAGDPPCDGETACDCGGASCSTSSCYAGQQSVCPAGKCGGAIGCDCRGESTSCNHCGTTKCPRSSALPCDGGSIACIVHYSCLVLNDTCTTQYGGSCEDGCCSQDVCPQNDVGCPCTYHTIEDPPSCGECSTGGGCTCQ